METLESIAVELSGAEEMNCPFPHRPTQHDEKNEIPPEVENSGSVLGAKLEGETHHVVTAPIRPPYAITAARKIDKVGYMAHHLIPGNEMWNNKGHPLHAWIHERVETKIKGDIGYINNEAFNGVDLPSHYLVEGWAGLCAKPGVQEGYANAAMTAAGSSRQFHDAHKAYSDMVWNALEKISAKLDNIVDTKGCGDENCSGAKKKPYDPPYGVLAQLEGVAGRLRKMVMGVPANWKPPVMTSRFALIYKTVGMTQEQARKALSAMRDEMGRPTR
jgi:hypothetical protein